MKQTFFSTASILLLCLCAALSSTSGAQVNRKYPYRFLIPEGYVGWVRIDFGVRDAPALPVEDGYYIVKIPVTGRLRTSSPIMLKRGDEYYYFSENTRYRLEINSRSPILMIQQEFTGPGPGVGPPNPYRYFFVGPRAEYEKCPWNYPCYEREEDGYPKTGSDFCSPRNNSNAYTSGVP